MKRRQANERALKFASRFAQFDKSAPDAVTGGAHLRELVWMNSADGAQYLRQPSRGAFRVWARRHHVVPVRRAGCVLYARADIDRVMGWDRRSA